MPYYKNTDPQFGDTETVRWSMSREHLAAERELLIRGVAAMDLAHYASGLARHEYEAMLRSSIEHLRVDFISAQREVRYYAAYDDAVCEHFEASSMSEAIDHASDLWRSAEPGKYEIIICEFLSPSMRDDYKGNIYNANAYWNMTVISE